MSNTLSSIFAIRVKNGFGLLQYLGYPGPVHYAEDPYYILYKIKPINLNPKEVSKALSGMYYYARFEDRYSYGNISYVDIAKQHPGVEVVISTLKKELELSDGQKKWVSPIDTEGCFLSYIGEYPLPADAEMPKFSRGFSISTYTGKYHWYLFDELQGQTIDGVEHGHYVYDTKGKVKKFYKLTEEISGYPFYGANKIKNILWKFDNDWSPEKCDDEWLKGELEKYYQEHPYERPGAFNFDDVKYLLPTDSWKESSQDWGEAEKAQYHEFCDRVEAELKEFIAELENNRRATQKPLIKLIEALNKMDEDIGTMEAEELYDYIAKILSSLNKGKQVEILDEMRKW